MQASLTPAMGLKLSPSFFGRNFRTLGQECEEIKRKMVKERKPCRQTHSEPNSDTMAVKKRMKGRIREGSGGKEGRSRAKGIISIN